MNYFLCCLSMQCLLLNFRRLPQMPAIKKIVYSMFYSFPVSLGQVYFVLVLTSTNHKARNRYPEMVMAQTVNADAHLQIYWSVNEGNDEAK